MSAALIIFFACFGACMATDARIQFLDQVIAQGQQMAATVLNMFSQQVVQIAQQVSQQIQQLAASLGGKGIFDGVLSQLQALAGPLLNQLVSGVLGSLNLSSILGGRADGVLSQIGGMFSEWFSGIQGALMGIGQHFVNQGLSAVLGAVGGMGGRGFGDIFGAISAQLSGLVSSAQTAVGGIWNNLTTIAGNVLETSKPHLAQLQEQLIGHGLNVLNSLGNTVTDLHGSLTGR